MSISFISSEIWENLPRVRAGSAEMSHRWGLANHATNTIAEALVNEHGVNVAFDSDPEPAQEVPVNELIMNPTRREVGHITMLRDQQAEKLEADAMAEIRRVIQSEAM